MQRTGNLEAVNSVKLFSQYMPAVLQALQECYMKNEKVLAEISNLFQSQLYLLWDKDSSIYVKRS